MTEITYLDAASILHCSPRHVRRVLKQHGIQPIRRGHRTVRISFEKVAALQTQLLKLRITTPTITAQRLGRGRKGR